MQDVYYGIRDKTRVIADQHANLGRTIDSSIVQHLQKLRLEIKAHIKVIISFVFPLDISDSHVLCPCRTFKMTLESWPPV